MNSNMSELRENGFRVLVKELGSVGTVNFLRQFECGSGNYTDERAELLDGITINDIVSSILEGKNKAG